MESFPTGDRPDVPSQNSGISEAARCDRTPSGSYAAAGRGALRARCLPLLRSHALFAGTTDEQLQRLLRGCREQSFEAGAVLALPGSALDGAFLVLEGQAELCVDGGPDDELVLRQLVAGDLVGLASLLGDRERRQTGLRCAHACRILEIPRAWFRDLLFIDPHWAAVVLRNLVSRQLVQLEELGHRAEVEA